MDCGIFYVPFTTRWVWDACLLGDSPCWESRRLLWERVWRDQVVDADGEVQFVASLNLEDGEFVEEI